MNDGEAYDRHLPRGVRRHLRRVLCRPADGLPPTDRRPPGLDLSDPEWTVSCPYCRFPLYHLARGFPRGQLVTLVCSPLRIDWCPLSALAARLAGRPIK